MGCVASSDDVHDPEQINRSREIDAALKSSGRESDKITRMLMIGAGDTGKSTFFKQLQLLYNPNRVVHAAENKRLINTNIIQSSQDIIRASETLGLPIAPENRDSAIEVLHSSPHFDVIPPKILQSIITVRSDPSFEKLVERSNEVTIGSNFLYFISNAEKLGAADYVPTEQDLLLCRNKTTGVTESKFVYKKKPFMIIDVGGQRTERKKWIHSFENVNTLLFFTSLSEFDQKLEEDPRVNRMHESLRLFKEVINSKWFTDVPISLMLNKRDIFAQKILHKDLRMAFPEYTGGHDYEAGLSFISERFLSTRNNESRIIYVHVICATDTRCIEDIFASISSHLVSVAVTTL